MPGVRYYDIRHVQGQVTHIDIDNGVCESAASSFFDHAVIRALSRQGWGILTVDDFQEVRRNEIGSLVDRAASIAAICEEDISLSQPVRGSHEVPRMAEDPRDVSLAEKAGILLELERSARIPGIQNTRINYIERFEKTRFCDSTGYENEFETCRSGFGVLVVAARNGTLQMGYERRHTIRGLNIRHQQELARSAAERAILLLDARPARGGTMRAVLDPELAGVFAHEAVGHASEADLVQEGSSVLAGKIGERIGTAAVTIVDDPSLPEFGFEPFDAEGSATGRTEIIRQGILSNYLHSRETLAAVGNGQAGHARAAAGEPPLVRMSNTYFEAGESTREEILAECRHGILLKGSRGGQVDPGRGVFQFNAEYGYLIEDGDCTTMVRDVSLSGEILKTLFSICLCGNEVKMHQGFCGKGGQSVPVSDGAPYLLLDGAVVGGSGDS
ncbi:MAG TPA: TldD/PmbA family protein [Methanoregulaceae archaeon]|nr:MAG: TldD/PmbA family protein [Methanolinea sp.]HON81744.1 TldD/PmbA family protein [Methanoregulaceae archaeon]HPD10552.1 TldD/PmbA family protein [Methanoregulaceae archaeon]HRT15599.1 TldD/PmbA family protein [Methanoregulaceae archaeon]HRU31171.1 TldD/PmbA family protein [Methanoregulaceae archaeon]